MATSSFVVSLTPSISASFNSTGRKTWRKSHFMTSIWTGVTSGDSWLIQSRSFASCQLYSGGRFRMDHMFCASERFVSSAGRLHHHADMFDEGIYYWVRNGRVHAGLIGVQYALTDTGVSQNHFCCIPGSHRANFPVPDACRQLEGNELLRHVPLHAGDALVFSEALVHGTYAVAGSSRRRAVFARYMNNHSYFRRPPEHTALTILPATPNHSEAPSSPFDASLLTERQRRLVAEPAYARGHEPLGVAP